FVMDWAVSPDNGRSARCSSSAQGRKHVRNSLKSADGSGFDHDDPAISAGGWDQPADGVRFEVVKFGRGACQKKKAGPEKKSRKPALAFGTGRATKKESAFFFSSWAIFPWAHAAASRQKSSPSASRIKSPRQSRVQSPNGVSTG